jgi:SAM-dependent methyltransferase
MNIDEAIRHLRADPRHVDLVRDAYLGEDLGEAAERFLRSAEFEEVRGIAGPGLAGGHVLDLGAGNGIASYAFALSGAGVVLALDPDPSNEVGIGALRALTAGLPVVPVAGIGEGLPFRDDSMDLVYARQVLHHASDLRRLLSECARVLKPGGTLLACREHVVDDARQLEEFLRNHPVHQLAGGENAYSLPEYLQAITEGGLHIQRTLRPWDSVINAFPAVRSTEELRQTPARLLKDRFGGLGVMISRVPGATSIVFSWLNRSQPGRLYSFVATKP